MPRSSTFQPVVNANPLAFENLANCLATVSAHFGATDGNMDVVVKEYERLFKQALRRPPNYPEITELTGEGASPNDRAAGRGAWTLMNIAKLDVQAVHTSLWEKLPQNKGHDVPLLRLLSRKLGVEAALSRDELLAQGQMSAKIAGKLSILGTRAAAIWAVQAISCDAFAVENELFRRRVFDEPKLTGKHLATLHDAFWLLTAAFPTVDIMPLVLVTHTQLPHQFELYRVKMPRSRPAEIILTEDAIIDSALNHKKHLEDDVEALWRLPGQLDNPVFRGLPPCRGGRTLGTLAAIALRQLESEDLIDWTETEIGDLYRKTFGYEVSRDKVRHDLGDRLIAQWFMKRRGNLHFLTVQGLARYLYSLAKYTSHGSTSAMDVLEHCTVHSQKIMAKYHAV